MISKNKIKQIKSLSQKKYRAKNNLFLAEGNKLVTEVAKSGIEIEFLAATEEFMASLGSFKVQGNEIVIVTHKEIKKVSLLKNPQQALALCHIPQQEFSIDKIQHSLALYLDNVQDPGNLGTIIRIADWFGIETVCASSGTADIYNPKAVQATMGAFCRVQVNYIEPEVFFTEVKQMGIPVFGAYLDGENIYNQDLPRSGIIIMGSEGHGISKKIEPFITQKLHIPGYQTSESLNVSIATAIICSEFRRKGLAGK